MKKRILIISYTDLSKDPRPLRQIRALNREHIVHTLAVAGSGEEHTFTKLGKVKMSKDIFRLILLKLGLYEKYYWDKHKKEALKKFESEKYDLVIAHEIRLLPLALRIANGIEVLLDAHEYSPKNFDDDPLWRFFIKPYYIWLCETYLPKIKTLFSVSKGIVEEYEKVFGVESILITNASDYYDLEPSPVEEKIKIVHHGIASSSRRLELMIDMMEHTDSRFELYLMLVHTKFTERYVNKLKKRAESLDNVFFIDPVGKSELVPFTNRFDIGLIFLPPVNFNLEHCLPNKFFEMLQARLAVASGPDLEMSAYINKFEFGIISESWEPKSMAKALNKLTLDDIRKLKSNSHRFAKDISAERETEKFLETVNRYL
jgi:hypothetical protein